MGNGQVSYQELDFLAGLVGVKSFINTKKQGYEFLLQPAGQHLSGRIVKKILLMRALVQHPKLLLLEEPWQGMEPAYQQKLQQHLLNNLPETTVIVVTNDQQFSSQCDKVLMLEKGTITQITQ